MTSFTEQNGAVAPASIDYGELIKDDRVHSQMYTNPEIFRREMEKIFHHGWVYVAHESEVPNAGDYVSRRIGFQSMILTRDAESRLHLLFDRCPHRGNKICQNERGHAPNFVCIYHGWVFDSAGKLAAMPSSARFPQDGAFNTSMAEAPRLETYGGFIFASLASDGISLTEHLGKGKALIDMINGLSPAGNIKLNRGWMKHRIQGNWKGLVENQCDGYHPAVTHASILRTNKAILGQRDRRDASASQIRDFGQGHSELDFAADFRARNVVLAWAGNITPNDVPEYVANMNAAYGEDEALRRLIDGPPHGVIFPNLLFAEMNMMVLEPVSEIKTVQYTTAVMLEGGAELNPRSLRRCEGALGPAGMLIADDGEIADMVQQGMATSEPEWILLRMGEGLETEDEDGLRIGGLKDETAQRGLWRHIRNVMTETA